MPERRSDTIGRCYMTGRRDPTRFPPVYQYVNPQYTLTRDIYIPVFLETQDPEFYLSGKAEILGFDPEPLDRAVLEMIRRERRIACSAFYWLRTNPGLAAENAGRIRRQSRELFARMLVTREEMETAGMEEKLALAGRMRRDNTLFHRLVMSSRLYPLAMTAENPYLKAFLRTEGMKNTRMMTFEIAARCCSHIEVKAEITDAAWLKRPVYQGEEGFRIPKMEIREITAVPCFAEYREALPVECTRVRSQQLYAARGRRMYREWEGREEATFLSEK